MGRGDMPDEVSDVLVHFGPVVVPEGNPPEVREIYERGANNRCMMCGGRLGEETVVLINLTGTNQIYCSHKCNQDMNVSGWLVQQYDDLKEGVELRGSNRSDSEPGDTTIPE